MSPRRKGGGLDISGAGKRSVKLPGGNPRNRKGLTMSTANARRGGTSRPAGGSRRRGSYIHPSNNKKSRISRSALIKIVVLIVCSLALATVVGVFVYQQTAKNALKSTLNEDQLSSVLTATDSKTSPFWGVLVKTDASSAEAGRGKLESLALVYVNPDGKCITFLWIPSDTRIYLDGYGYRSIAEAFDLQGERGITVATEKLASVEASHYFEMNNAGLARLEDGLAPLGIDPAAADTTTLTTAITKKICGSSNEQIATVASTFTTCVSTDADTSTMSSVFSAMQGVTDAGIYQSQAPVSSQSSGSGSYSTVETDSWNSMVTRTAAGLSPVASQAELASYANIRSSATVDIWNGVGVTGVANDCKKELEQQGWKIGSSGNASQFVYEETLVVYKDSAHKSAAQLLVSDLGQGRVVNSAARYSFLGDVLVVVGKNYKPY